MFDRKTGRPSLPCLNFGEEHLGDGLPTIENMGCAYSILGFVVFLIALVVNRFTTRCDS